MAAYAQFGYGGYPTANQLLTTNSDPSVHAGESSTASNAPPHSPAGEVRINSTVAADASSGALSPDGLSQASNVACASAVVGGTGTTNNTTLNADNTALGHVGISTTTTCCENGRPILTDPVSGQTVCSCQYDSARLALSGYSRLPTGGVGVYGTPYPSTDQNPYQSIGVDSSAFYSPLSNPYALKDSTTGSEMTAWTSAGLQPTTGYYSYDPMGAYGYGASYDLAARRKNATRESTATLKAWLNEHKKNPYPTKGEKIMLAIITKMTLTQVSTWFANARRRLKKENKMTWEPKNRTDDDDDALVSDDEKDKDDLETEKPSSGAAIMGSTGAGIGVIGDHRKDSLNQHHKSDLEKHEDELPVNDHRSEPHTPDMRSGYPGAGYHSGSALGTLGSHPHNYHPYHHPQHAAYYQHQQAVLAASYHPNNKEDHSDPKNQLSRDCGVPIPATKPKIWSLADTVACKTPPIPATFMGPQQQLHQMTPQQHMSASLNMATLAPLRQQQQQQHQHQLQQQHIMNNIAAAPFSRAPSVAYGSFLGTTAQHLHTTNNSPYHSGTNNNGSSSSSNNSNSTSNIISGNSSNMSTTPTLAQLQHQQQHLHQQHHQHNQQHSHQQHQSHHQHTASQRMGFPEVQPDTPPQTPPNMKVPSVAANLLLTATQTPTIDTYRSTNTAFAANISRFSDYSPRDDCSSRSSSSASEGPSNDANYQQFFRGQYLTGFVPPV